MVKLAEVRKFAREFSHGLDLKFEISKHLQRTEVGLYAPTFRNIQNTVTRVISRFEIQVGYLKLKYNFDQKCNFLHQQR